MTQEQLNEIRAQYDALVNMRRDIGIHHRYNAAMEVHANIPALLDALEAEKARGISFDALIKSYEKDCNFWRERAEALERVIKADDNISCRTCVNQDSFIGCDECANGLKDNWEFKYNINESESEAIQ